MRRGKYEFSLNSLSFLSFDHTDNDVPKKVSCWGKVPKELIVRKGPPGTGRRMIEEVTFDEIHTEIQPVSYRYLRFYVALPF